MKYNLSEIMKNAHGFRKAHKWTMAESLRRAWTRAKNQITMEAHNAAKAAEFEAMSISEKIAELESRFFMLNMADRLSYDDRLKMAEIRREIERLTVIERREDAA